MTCKYLNSICQKCYGLNLSSQKIINIGDTIGILAAQSISEPSTQLTMRTFHTGGIFTNKEIEKIDSNFSGFIFIKNKNNFFIKNWKNTNQILLKTELSNIKIKNLFINKDQNLTNILLSKNNINNNKINNKLQNYIGLYSLIVGSVNFKEYNSNNFLQLNQNIKIIKFIKKNKILNYFNKFFIKILYIYLNNKYKYYYYFLNRLKLDFFLHVSINLKLNKSICIINNRNYIIKKIKIKKNNKIISYFLFFNF